jgi:hypothetical protein
VTESLAKPKPSMQTQTVMSSDSDSFDIMALLKKQPVEKSPNKRPVEPKKFKSLSPIFSGTPKPAKAPVDIGREKQAALDWIKD